MIALRASLGAADPGRAFWPANSGIASYVKSRLAQLLLDRAWRRMRNGQARVRPWPWADSWPVARLSGAGGAVYILAHTARTLYGPGLVAGSATPGSAGNSIIAGDRETPVRFLQLLADNTVTVETADGATRHYRIVDRRVLDARQIDPLPARTVPMLTLVTDYPFDGNAGALRYVVTAISNGG
jgi:sortase A